MNAAVCPYCRGSIEQDEAQSVLCPGCGTPHHADCFEENGGCTVFGCSAAPAAEPKLSIAVPELHQAAAPGAAPPPTPPVPPPPLIQAAPQSTELPEAPPLFSSLGYGRPQTTLWQAPTPRLSPAIDPTLPAKNRTVFLLLGVLLGPFGAHSFYARSVKKGFLQLAITLLTFGLAGLMVWVWAVIDICTISTDHDGIPFRN